MDLEEAREHYRRWKAGEEGVTVWSEKLGRSIRYDERYLVDQLLWKREPEETNDTEC
jgi:hypothetical protein